MIANEKRILIGPFYSTVGDAKSHKSVWLLWLAPHVIWRSASVVSSFWCCWMLKNNWITEKDFWCLSTFCSICTTKALLRSLRERKMFGGKCMLHFSRERDVTQKRFHKQLSTEYISDIRTHFHLISAIFTIKTEIIIWSLWPDTAAGNIQWKLFPSDEIEFCTQLFHFRLDL